MGSGIFISYRRADSRHAAGRLADELAAAFGERNIFRDIEGIDIGVNFATALERALGECVVMLVIIGPQWLEVRTESGQRRLDQPEDWTRQEVATALQRGIPVVPVLLEDTPLPRPDQLPPDLRELASRQQFNLSDGRWRGDVQALVEKLARVPGLQRVGPPPVPPPPPPPAKRGWHWGWWVGAGVLALGALVNEFDLGGGSEAPDSGAGPDHAVTPAGHTTNPPADTNAEPAPPAPVPRLAGLWRTASNETYHFEQDGNQVRFTSEANGQAIGGGRGELEGRLLRLHMTLQMTGMPVISVVCDMQGAPDWRSFTGTCLGPTGQFQAQFFR